MGVRGVGKMKRFSIQEPCCHCAVLILLLHATLSKEVSGDTSNRSASLSLSTGNHFAFLLEFSMAIQRCVTQLSLSAYVTEHQRLLNHALNATTATGECA